MPGYYHARRVVSAVYDRAGYDEHLMRKLFLAAALLTVSIQAVPQAPPTQTSARMAVERALPLLQRSAAEFVSKRACFSCHHNALPILTLHMARDRGVTIDSLVLAAVEDKTFAPLRGANALDQTIQAVTLSDPTPNDSYLLMAAAAAGLDRSLTLAVRAQQLLGWQQDSHWKTSDFRPPHSSSTFTATATAIRAITLYAPEELRDQSGRALNSARGWLKKTRPASTEDASFRLMGLVWAGAPTAEVNSAATDLLSMQQQDGGWPQLRGYASDAYSTGESLFALREAKVAANTPPFERGIKFLLSTQAADGTWHVKTRMQSPAEVSPPYFATGFPYAKDEFLSYAGTSWAVMALLRTLPDPAEKSLRSEQDSEPWMRTALFGTTKQLLSLLDKGLSANARTPEGTTLLMMAAPNPEKVRALISRGADIKARGASGHDALTIAAAYRGTADSLRELIGAGADVAPPDGIQVRRAPIVFAAMNGDLDNVKLLLHRGAAPEGEALAESITFDHPEVVDALIRAGADTGLTESSGVNLLHWATITGRADVISVLVKAGLPLNETDKAGFTPLMYAATIDFGDIAALRALLSAGADRSIRNSDGRTALEQARYLQHTALETALARAR